jgi:hypothetical protein
MRPGLFRPCQRTVSSQAFREFARHRLRICRSVHPRSEPALSLGFQSNRRVAKHWESGGKGPSVATVVARRLMHSDVPPWKSSLTRFRARERQETEFAFH